MIVKTWTNLLHIIGELQGMATVLDMTEEVDLKKLKSGLNDVSTKLQTIADEEGAKLEDIQKPAAKKNGGKKP